MFRVLILVLFVLVLFAAPVMAQDGDPSGPALPPVDVETDAAALIQAVIAILTGFAASPLVTTIVGALKMIPALDRFSPQVLTFATAALLYGGAALASRFGAGEQFYSFAELVYRVLPAALAFIATLVGAPAVYEAAKQVNAPVVGYQRQ